MARLIAALLSVGTSCAFLAGPLPARSRSLRQVREANRKANVMSAKNVAIISTSAGSFAGGPTGLWLEELATPYYAFKQAGHEVIVASPAGGAIPIDAGSMGEGFFTDESKKFLHDPEAVGALCHSVKFSALDLGKVDCLYFAGGHGTVVDFADNAELKAAVESFYAGGKVVAAACHGPIVLAQCVKPDGTPLISGLACTGFTDSEEAAVGLTDKVPFLIETRFKEQGGLFESGADWNPKVVTAGKIITGQNPQSSAVTAEAVIAALA